MGFLQCFCTWPSQRLAPMTLISKKTKKSRTWLESFWILLNLNDIIPLGFGFKIEALGASPACGVRQIAGRWSSAGFLCRFASELAGAMRTSISSTRISNLHHTNIFSMHTVQYQYQIDKTCRVTLEAVAFCPWPGRHQERLPRWCGVAALKQR